MKTNNTYKLHHKTNQNKQNAQLNTKKANKLKDKIKNKMLKQKIAKGTVKKKRNATPPPHTTNEKNTKRSKTKQK